MYRVITLLLAGFCFVFGLSAQDDSVKTVTLSNVTIVGAEKNMSAQLQQFFRANAAATVEEIMSRLPELSLVRRGSYGMEPTIRSLNGGQINLLIDGMRIHGACTDKMDPATIYVEPVNLENIQLTTGGQGTAKGSSIGGTIDMALAAPKYSSEGPWHGSVQTAYQGASNGWHQAATVNYSSKQFAIRGSGTYRTADNYRDGNGNEVMFSQYNKWNASLSANYRLNEHTRLKADVLADDGWNIGYPALPMDVGYAKARIAAISISKSRAGSRWQQMEAKAYANRVEHSMDDTQRPNVPMHMDMPGLSETAGFYANGSYKLNDRQSLTMRIDGASTFLKASMTMYPPGETPMYMLTWPDNRRNQLGTSAVWKWAPDSLLQLNVTARIDGVQSKLSSQEAKDHISVLGGCTDARFDLLSNLSLSGSKRLANGWQVGVSVGVAQRMPTASELYGFYLFNAFDNYDYVGNTALKSETAINAEAFVSWKLKQVKLQFTGFYNHIGHYILGRVDPSLSSMTIGSLGVKVYENMPWAQMAGAEFSVQYKPFERILLLSTLRASVAEGSDGLPLPFIPPLKNITSVRYAYGRISAQLEYEASLKQTRINEQAGETTTPGFVLAHARVGYVLPLWKNQISCQAGVENMFNEAYQEHLDWGNVLRPGRNMYATLRCTF